MKIHFNNYAKKLERKAEGYQYYQWKIFVDEKDKVLDKIDNVVYLLHETFPDPARVVRDRKSNFALESSGWGSFTVHITVKLKSGAVVRTKYYLDLHKKWPRLRESYSTNDKGIARHIEGTPELQGAMGEKARKKENVFSLLETLKKVDPADRAYMFKSLAVTVLKEDPDDFLKDQILGSLYGEMSSSLLEWSLSFIEEKLTTLKPAWKPKAQVGKQHDKRGRV